jgi:hypothetical protein
VRRFTGTGTSRDNVSMADGRTRRMHTVPEGYFEAFAVQDPTRRTSGVWRFDRISGESKVLGIGDAEVVRDIYTVFDDEGAPDTGIEDELLCGLEGDFCRARTALLERLPLSKENWSGLARFTSVSLIAPASTASTRFRRTRSSFFSAVIRTRFSPFRLRSRALIWSAVGSISTRRITSSLSRT